MHFFERKNEFETLLWSFFLIDAAFLPHQVSWCVKKKKKDLKTPYAIFKHNREYIKWIPSIQGGSETKIEKKMGKIPCFIEKLMNLQWKSP
jgi:hypothetical protein